MKAYLTQNNLPVIKILMLSSVLFLTACQPKGADQDKASQDTSAVAKTDQWVASKTVAFTATQTESCDAGECTKYDLQTVETNYPWINEYFIERIKKTVPLAFQADKNSAASEVIVASKTIDEKNLGESSVVIRFIGQNQNLATFEMLSYTYNAGAAHGMYHKEYVNFDLKSKKRIALQDLIVAGTEKKLIEALYRNNMMWLDDHSIEQAKLQLSDNFYYGANGIVFVYPLYDLASYAEGMSELTLPYQSTVGLIKAAYLPNLPQYKTE